MKRGYVLNNGDESSMDEKPRKSDKKQSKSDKKQNRQRVIVSESEEEELTESSEPSMSSLDFVESSLGSSMSSLESSLESFVSSSDSPDGSTFESIFVDYDEEEKRVKHRARPKKPSDLIIINDSTGDLDNTQACNEMVEPLILENSDESPVEGNNAAYPIR